MFYVSRGGSSGKYTKGKPGCRMFPSCLESQGCYLIPLSCLLSCSSVSSHGALSVLSCFRIVSANGPASSNISQYLSLRDRLLVRFVERLLFDSSQAVCESGMCVQSGPTWY